MGATFTVSLRAAGERDAQALRDRKPPAQADAEDLSGARVLMVEDEADAGDLARIILERAGANVVQAWSAREALSHLDGTARPFDLIVSDLGMPGMDGFDLLCHVRRAEARPGRRTPALAVSAYARPGDRTRATDAGFDAFLSKPFQPADLVASCAALLEKTQRAAPGLS